MRAGQELPAGLGLSETSRIMKTDQAGSLQGCTRLQTSLRSAGLETEAWLVDKRVNKLQFDPQTEPK